MDQGLLSGTTVLVLSAKSATRFPKTGWKMQLFAQQGNQGREDTKAQAALLSQRKHRLCLGEQLEGKDCWVLEGTWELL